MQELCIMLYLIQNLVYSDDVNTSLRSTYIDEAEVSSSFLYVQSQEVLELRGGHVES